MSRELFKAEFVKKARAAGLSPAQTLARAERLRAALEKQAGGLSDALWHIVNDAWAKYQASGLTDQIKQLGLLGTAAGGVPLIAGLGAGALASKLRGESGRDLQAVQKEELIAELQRQAELARERRRAGAPLTTST